jgi:hypothetical protein
MDEIDHTIATYRDIQASYLAASGTLTQFNAVMVAIAAQLQAPLPTRCESPSPSRSCFTLGEIETVRAAETLLGPAVGEVFPPARRWW